MLNFWFCPYPIHEILKMGAYWMSKSILKGPNWCSNSSGTHLFLEENLRYKLHLTLYINIQSFTSFKPQIIVDFIIKLRKLRGKIRYSKFFSKISQNVSIRASLEKSDIVPRGMAWLINWSSGSVKQTDQFLASFSTLLKW